jgi:hypothetical protein
MLATFAVFVRARPVGYSSWLGARIKKACGRRCANLVRVYKFRRKKVEYAAKRKFRKRTGLRTDRQGRQQLMQLTETLRIGPKLCCAIAHAESAGTIVRCRPLTPDELTPRAIPSYEEATGRSVGEIALGGDSVTPR